MKTITEMLYYEFAKLHAKFRTVSCIHLNELHEEISNWKRDGQITETFYEQNYSEFSFRPPTTLQNACSIIVIGIPQKTIPLEFVHNQRRYQTVIPPTYVYSTIRATCKEILSGILQEKGFSVDRAILPMKLLAVRSGLGKYGKNNICYVDGMGSFTRLEAFYTDYGFPTDDWCEKEVMESCSGCSLCRRACPTKCIPKDRFLIHADHCLTYFNEGKGDFPSWVPVQSHNALVGCLHCQNVCPQNKQRLLSNEPIISFTEEETRVILQHTPRKDVPPVLEKKLKNLNLDEYYSLLARNLSVLINK